MPCLYPQLHSEVLELTYGFFRVWVVTGSGGRHIIYYIMGMPQPPHPYESKKLVKRIVNSCNTYKLAPEPL